MFTGGYQIVDFSNITITKGDLGTNIKVGSEIIKKLKNTRKAVYINNLCIEGNDDTSDISISGYASYVLEDEVAYLIANMIITVTSDETVMLDLTG